MVNVLSAEPLPLLPLPLGHRRSLRPARGGRAAGDPVRGWMICAPNHLAAGYSVQVCNMLKVVCDEFPIEGPCNK